MTLSQIENEVKVAMKAGDKSRVTSLRMLVNETKKVAKSDGNREPIDDDVITAGNRLVKQTRETISFLKEGDAQVQPLNDEIAIYEEFLPQKMDRAALTTLIEGLISSPDAPEGKAAKGFIMKNLNQSHRGFFDPAMANEVITEKLA
jgi:uncharacterized protein YqeY